MFRWTLNDLDSNVIEVLRKDGRLSDPKGYEGLTLTHERDDTYHGISYDFTTELGFFCKGGGKELIDAAYELKSQEANVRIKLEVKCNGEYVTMLEGKLNFASYRQEWVAGVLYSFLDAEKDDIKIKLMNREDMEVDLLDATSLDGVALNSYPYLGYDINLHSKVIRLESEWNSVYHGCCFRFITAGLKTMYLIPTTEIIQGDFIRTEKTDSRCVAPTVFDNFLDDAQFIVNTANNGLFVQQNTVTVTWNIAGNITITTYDVTAVPSDCEDTCGTGALNDVLFDSVDFTLRLYFGNPDSGTIQEANDCGASPIYDEGIKYIDLVTIPTFVSSGNPDVKYFANSGNRDIILQPGDKVWYYWVADLNLISACDMKIEFNYSASLLNILSDTTFDSTPCKGIAIHEAWSRLCERITDQNLAFYSEFFGRTDSNISYAQDGCGSKLAITSGEAIRQIGNRIKPSLKTMFDSCNAVYGIGLGIEKYQGVDVVRAEEVDYFYQTTEILRLSNVPNITMRHVGERVYNEINIGFAKWETNSATGLDEPLTRINYVVPPIKNNKNKFDAISPFVAGMYAIELTRRSQTETKKDTSFDEDIFFLCLNDVDLTVCEKDEKFNSISGLISPETAYNLRFLLSMTFDRLKNVFVSGLTKLGTLANPVVMPAEAEGNDDVQYQYVDGCAGDGFGSNQSNGRAGRYPHAFARRDNPIWLPEEYTFDYPLSFTNYINLVENPYGLIYFSETDGNFKSGWLLNLEYNIRNKSGTFTILRNSGLYRPDLELVEFAGFDYDGDDYDEGDYFAG